MYINMKKILFFAASMLCFAACGQGGSKPQQEGGEETTTPVTEVVEEVEVEIAKPTKPMVYSNAYDGYVDIREAASLESLVLGQLHNGPEGAEVVGVEGEWTKVYINGIVGYVPSADIQNTPTVAVDLNISADKLQGVWSADGYAYYFIFDNGTYCIGDQYGSDLFFGTYVFAGSEIVLTHKHYTELANEYGRQEEKGERISVKGNKLGNMHREQFLTAEELIELDEMGMFDGFVITEEAFNEQKRIVMNKLKFD